ncbi:hypothetical protein LBMAG46_34850 [Planctomycetia bacterium]|nr:hypothetical protein LBMAG46_34850 [Planctomycetia bacterium]
MVWDAGSRWRKVQLVEHLLYEAVFPVTAGIRQFADVEVCHEVTGAALLPDEDQLFEAFGFAAAGERGDAQSLPAG